LKITVLTLQMNITFSARLLSSPGSENHQRNVQTEASTTSTYIPAAPIAARCHLLGSIQESETLQYRQGVSTRNMTPISWHSPPKCLHDSPWANSCITLVTASVAASRSQLEGVKNWWKVGSFARNVANCTETNSKAATISPRAITSAVRVKSQRTLG